MVRHGLGRRAALAGALAALAQPARAAVALERLVAAYTGHLAGIDGPDLVWTDGTRMPTGADLPARPFRQMLLDASIADMLRQTYVPGPWQGPAAPDDSPGRIRNTAFFLKMYGDCRAGRIPLRRVIWMPRTRPQPLSITTVNNVADRLERVIDQLELLPDRLKSVLVPSSGAYTCRVVADTRLPSMHGTGAAIDLAAKGSDYWAWARGRPAPPNRVPDEVVEIFEAEHFIWGGKWHQYDLMHFEYRPELFGDTKPLKG